MLPSRTATILFFAVLASVAHSQTGAKIFGQANSQEYSFVPSDKLDYALNNAPAFSEAHADVHTGIMRGAARAEASDHTYAIFNSQVFDTLTLVGPGTDAVAMTFTLRVTMNRSWQNLLGDRQSEGMISGAMLKANTIGSTNEHYYRSAFFRDGVIDGNGLKTVETYETGFIKGTGQVVAESHDGFDVILTATAMVAPGQDVFFFQHMFGSAQSDKGVNCLVDGMHTGVLTMSLPDGYSYTSLSGHFLDQPVPEPASCAALGLGALALLRRRRFSSSQ